ncbi:MAG TPA: hypothetical protein VHF92_06225 [Geodermatophilus sp.]|nr:hypothetical protein [Geodermatophilus sp.]
MSDPVHTDPTTSAEAAVVRTYARTPGSLMARMVPTRPPGTTIA